MFLVPSARGRGLGPDAARALTESLLASGWTRVTVDPYAWNEPAIRAWRRAGFVDVETRGRRRRALVGVGADGVSVGLGIVLSVAVLLGIRRR